MSQLSVLASRGRRPVAFALLGLAALGLSACASKDRPRADLAASQVTTNRRHPRRIFGFQAIENSLRIESRHGAHSCGKMVSVWLADGNLH